MRAGRQRRVVLHEEAGRRSGGGRGRLTGRRAFANPPGRATSRCPVVSGTNRT